MDLLKAELERKRKAIAAAKDNDNSGGEVSSTRRYLTASERRRRLEEEEDERRWEGTKKGKEESSRRREGEEEEESRRKKKNKKRRRRGNHDDDDDDDDDGEEEEEDLTTMITRRYDPSSSRGGAGMGRGGSIDGTVEAGGRASSSSSSSSGAAVASSSSSSSSIGKNNEDCDDRGGGGGSGSSSRDNASSSSTVDDNIQLPPADATNALRRFGLPVRLFGEDENSRLKRLSIAMIGRENDALGECERDEFLLDRTSRTRNVFLEREDDNEQQGGGGVDVVVGGDGKVGGGDGVDGIRRDGAVVAASSAATSVVPLTEEELNDRPKRIYRYFKSLLRQWEEDLSRRPDSIKRTASGKNETKTLKQCKDYIRPLFQLCKRRELEEGLQSHLFDIVVHCEMGEFVRAHDAYMDVAIGRAAWPIGVTMVGIHARSGRAKIESSNVAHMMNSEVNRKYLTSVKRLMSYAQRKRPDVHPSKKVMNV
ncbi:hypothetical protein ACHAW5_007359 [Stephanodiscus triporus]|uniref:Pre-mRNA-splicing factor 18 n=1 Tax=Stephanodiscus triporus TaxID=2934178 RepID=A0ABD3NV39_9STRA